MADEQPKSGRTALLRLWRPVLLLILVGAVWVLATRSDLQSGLQRLEGWIRGLGPAAPVGFVLVRAGFAVAAIPGSAVSALAGVLFDPVVGVACVSAGKTIGAAFAFLIARYFARDSVETWLSGRPRFHRLDRLVTEHGALAVALNRLFPIVPFNLQNYGFGLTRIPFGTYLLWTWLGMLPGAVLVVTGVGVIRRTLATGRVPWGLLGAVAGSAALMLGLSALTLLRILSRRGADGTAPGAGR